MEILTYPRKPSSSVLSMFNLILISFNCFNWEIYLSNVPVKSKLQHPPPPGNPRAFVLFAKFLFKFPPPEAEKLFKCPIIVPFQVIKCPHPWETFR